MFLAVLGTGLLLMTAGIGYLNDQNQHESEVRTAETGPIIGNYILDCTSHVPAAKMDVMLPFVNCPICSQPNVLPFPNLQGRTTVLHPRPKDGWRLRLACHLCGHTYVYSESNLHWRPVQVQDRTLLNSSLVRVESECEQGCKGLLIVWHTRVGIPTGNEPSLDEFELLRSLDDTGVLKTGF